MPSRKKWTELLRGTFSAVGREDLTGLYSQEWRRAQEALTAEAGEPLKTGGGRIRRFFRTTNSVLYGLARRLAPARRVVFLVVLLCLVMSMCGPEFHWTDDKVEGGVTKERSYRVDFDATFLMVSTVLLGLLLGMELVDKINFRDELELARDLQGSLIPKELPQNRRLHGRSAQRDRQHGRRRHLRLRSAPGRAAGGPLRRRVGPRDGGGSRDGRRARGVSDSARRGPFAAGHARDPEPDPLPHRRSAGVLLVRLSPASDDGSFAGSVAGHPQPLLLAAEAPSASGSARAPTPSASGRI